MLPVTLAYLRLCRPRIAALETALPDPDSPTIPSVLPLVRSKSRPSTAFTTPSAVVKCTLRSRTERTFLDEEDVWAACEAVDVMVVLLRRSADSDPGVDHGVQHVDDDVRDDH